MLTPAELKKKELEERKKRFYDKEETDTLLQEIYANYDELYSKYEEMTRNAKKLSDGVQYYKSIETTLQKALVLAEKTAKETKDAAEQKAAVIEQEAEKKAQLIIDDAQKECETVKLRCNHLVDLFKQYKTQFIQVTSNNLKLLNSKEFDIDAPELEEMYRQQKPDTENGIQKQLETTQDLVAAISSNLSNPLSEPVIKKIPEPVKTPEPTPAPAKVTEVAPSTEESKESPEQDDVLPPKMVYTQAEPSQEVAATEEKVNETLKEEETKEAAPINIPEPEPEKEEKPQTLDALLNDLNMNGKKSDDEDPFEFLGSLDDF